MSFPRQRLEEGDLAVWDLEGRGEDKETWLTLCTDKGKALFFFQSGPTKGLIYPYFFFPPNLSMNPALGPASRSEIQGCLG